MDSPHLQSTNVVSASVINDSAGNVSLPLLGSRLTCTGKLFCVLLLACFALDGAKQFIFWNNGQAPLYKDTAQLWTLGEQVAAGDVLLADPPHLQRPIGYPAFLAVCQRLFGDDAIAGAAAVQHMLVLMTTGVTALGCWWLTRSRVAVVLSCGLSVLCVSRAWFADSMAAETVFTFLLVVHFATLIVWFQMPGWKPALAAGITLGLSILVRPVSQWWWLVTFGGFILAGLVGMFPRRIAWRDAAIGLLATSVVVLPWVVRGQMVYGKPFLSKSGGRSLWLSVFSSADKGIGNDGAGLPIPWDDLTPDDRAAIESLSDDVDLTHTWAVIGGLMLNGMPERDAEDLMKRVAVAGMRARPLDFALSVGRRFMRFWVVTHVRDRGQARYNTQPKTVMGHLKNAYRFYAFHIQGIVNAVLALAVFGAAGILVWRPPTRVIGLVFLGTLVYFGAVTAVGAQPAYRYRMILEPIMIVCLVFGLTVARTGFTGGPARPLSAEPA